MPTARETIESLYAAFARGDAGFVLGLLADDVQWNDAEGSPMASGNPYSSPQQVGEGVFGRVLGTFNEFTAVPDEMIAEGDRVVALGRYKGVHNVSGARLDAQFAHVWVVSEGKVRTFQQYTDTEQHARLMG